MKILFVCTSNKDRSPALEKYFSDLYSQHDYRSAGVNWYFTNSHGTRYLNQELIDWADLIVYAEDIHYKIASKNFGCGFKDCISLNLGVYEEGQIGQDYLIAAEEKLKAHL